MPFTKEDVLRVVRMKGPIFPNRIKRELGGDTTFIGAFLSELCASGQIKITKVKIGGSPFYYAAGQEQKLESLAKHLNEKDRRGFEQLHTQKIIRDKTQTPLLRVSLRAIKDFASPLTVNVDGEQELFWKYYLLSNSEAEILIRKILGIHKETPEVPRQTKLDQPSKGNPARPMRTLIGKQVLPQQKQKRIAKKKIKPIQKHLDEDEEEDTFEYSDKFYKQVMRYFNDKKIRVLKKDLIRKNSDIEMIVTVPSAIGRQEFFCKCKNKKKSNDGDLASALLQGKIKNLSVLYVTTGDVTKKAIEKIKDEFKGLVVKQI